VGRAEAERAAAEARLEAEMAVHVNKEVVATLFLNYDDESKEWGVRRNIKHQLYALLGLNDRIPKEQPANSSSKWFGLF
jgi:hypothetical protein